MLRNTDTPDVRRMTDLGGMRPVDVARSYGFQRITALVDPSRPVELLAYVTSGALRLALPRCTLPAEEAAPQRSLLGWWRSAAARVNLTMPPSLRTLPPTRHLVSRRAVPQCPPAVRALMTCDAFRALGRVSRWGPASVWRRGRCCIAVRRLLQAGRLDVVTLPMHTPVVCNDEAVSIRH